MWNLILSQSDVTDSLIDRRPVRERQWKVWGSKNVSIFNRSSAALHKINLFIMTERSVTAVELSSLFLSSMCSLLSLCFVFFGFSVFCFSVCFKVFFCFILCFLYYLHSTPSVFSVIMSLCFVFLLCVLCLFLFVVCFVLCFLFFVFYIFCCYVLCVLCFLCFVSQSLCVSQSLTVCVTQSSLNRAE